ncbi:MAG TPA: DUF308 domain-containing protein [Solirubrobacteraceae bacterium]|nr:DUF308 domain-containing protein [Solirubrobacteraceae bacterium]
MSDNPSAGVGRNPSARRSHAGPRMQMTSGVFIFAGVVSVIAGLLAIFVPGPTLVFLAIVIGFNLIVVSILGLVELVVDDDFEQGSKVGSGLLCALALVAGLVVLRHPDDSVLALVMAIGIWFVIAGIFSLISAPFADRGRGWRVLWALAEIALGVVVLALPDVSVKTLAVLAGIGFCVRGVVYVIEGIAMRHVGHGDGPAPVAGAAQPG